MAWRSAGMVMIRHPLDIDVADLGSFRMVALSEPIEPIAQQIVRIDPWRTLHYSPGNIQKYLSSVDDCLRCMAIMANRADHSPVAGVLCVRFPWLLGASLELFAIFPDYQRNGLGTTVLSWLEQRVAARTKNLWILVSSFNDPARTFYRQQGYQEIGTISDLIKVGFDEILLRKNLIQSA